MRLPFGIYFILGLSLCIQSGKCFSFHLLKTFWFIFFQPNCVCSKYVDILTVLVCLSRSCWVHLKNSRKKNNFFLISIKYSVVNEIGDNLCVTLTVAQFHSTKDRATEKKWTKTAEYNSPLMILVQIAR